MAAINSTLEHVMYTNDYDTKEIPQNTLTTLGVYKACFWQGMRGSYNNVGYPQWFSLYKDGSQWKAYVKYSESCPNNGYCAEVICFE